MPFYNHLTESTSISMEFESMDSDEPNILQLEMDGLIRSCNKFCQIQDFRFAANMNQGLRHDECNDPNKFLIEMFKKYLYVKSLVLAELKNWQIRQIQLVIANDKQHLNNLNQIQIWFEHLYDLNSRMLKLVYEHMRSHAFPDERLKQLAPQMVKHQKHLLVNSFIVEIQPKRVITKNRKFKASVRWLIGSRMGLTTDIHINCMVISDAEAKEIYKERHILNEVLPEPKNKLQNKSSMHCQTKTNSYTANFKLEFKDSKRVAEKRGSESVLNEKLVLLFYFRMTVNGSNFYLKTLSLPFVLVVHGSQEWQAWATIVWDNAFLQIGHEFQTPQTVSWSKLLKAIKTMFVSFTDGREYTPQNEYFLYEKLFQNGTVMDSEAEVNWGMFCKNDLPEGKFSFWEWFYFTAKLIKNYFREPWQKNLIEGYISKKTTENYLMPHYPGMFLLRFSERKLGAISISHVHAEHEIHHLKPLDSKFFLNSSLGELIQKVEFITTLFPSGMHKDKFPSKTNAKERKQKKKETDLSGYFDFTVLFKKTKMLGNWLTTTKTQISDFFNENACWPAPDSNGEDKSKLI